MDLDIGRSSAGAQSAILVLDEQLANQGFAKTEARLALTTILSNINSTHFDICGAPAWSGKGMSSLRMFANVALRFLPLNGVVP